jgi:glycosyltransferase involved in cell wall biosynthesis
VTTDTSISSCDLSAIVIVGQRHDTVRGLFLEYWNNLSAMGIDFELIYVLDGHRPDVRKILGALQDEGYQFRIIVLSRGFGEATALMCGFDQARGDLILTLPAYYQVETGQLGQLIRATSDADMAIARRSPRRGGSFETFRRKTFHRLLGRIMGFSFHDLGCSVRVFKRIVLDELRLYGDQHRFLPALAVNNGFKVVEVNVPQSAKDDFRGRYRWREYLHRLLDIFTVFFLIRFTKKPLRFFGMIGSVLFAAGSALLLIIIAERLFFDKALADRPALLLSSLLTVLGLQVFSLGLLGELIIFTHARSLKEYKIAKIITAQPADPDPGDESVQKPPTLTA